MPANRASSRRAPAPWIVAGLSLLAVLATARAAGPAGPEIVSVTPAGAPGNGGSYEGAVTSNGRFVAFSSDATDLVPGDTNGARDVFVRDRRAGTMARVSDSDGNLGGDGSYSPSISANGRLVAFYSSTTNLVPGDTNGATDVFVQDARTGETTRVSTAADGTEGDGSSGLGGASISATGRWVVFYSSASNLVPGDTNGAPDIFVRDRKTGTVTRVSVDSDGSEADSFSSGPSISANGRFVVFYSRASNLAPGDTNDAEDVFVHDLRTGTTTRVSVDSDGNQADDQSFSPVVTSNGRLVAFDSGATNLVPGDANGASYDIFVHDLRTGETRLVSVDSAGQQGNSDSSQPALPSNGKFVMFYSDASNLVPGDTNGFTDVFLHDLRTGATRRLSVDAQGGEGDRYSYVYATSLSANGRFLAMASSASNFAAGDTNGTYDVFLLDLR